MWFVGLIIGGCIGAVVRGVEGFLLGAVLGAILPIVLRQGSQAGADSRVDALGKAVDELRSRVSALERRAGASAAASESPIAVEPALRPDAAPPPVVSTGDRIEPASVPLTTPEDL